MVWIFNKQEDIHICDIVHFIKDISTIFMSISFFSMSTRIVSAEGVPSPETIKSSKKELLKELKWQM